MPTGYTASVQDGSTTEFKDFALQCARAFGALVSMREEPKDATLPDTIEPLPYHKAALLRAQEDLKRIETLSDRDVAREADIQYERALELHRNCEAKRLAQLHRYETMLAKAQAWEPPTSDHQGLKRFMIEQLTESIRFDCTGYEPKEPQRKTEAAWRADAVERAKSDVAYHTKRWQEERERAASRTTWLRKLRASL